MPFTPTVAVLGTGTMGAGMTRSLRRAGLPVQVWNRHPEKAAPLAESGAVVATSLEDAVRGAQVVVSILFDEASVAEVMAAAIPALDPGTVWVQASTVGPEGVVRLGELATPHGVPFYDAPVLGTKQPAETGRLTVLASGPLTPRDVLEPVFAAIGAKTVWLGETAGPASAMKLIANGWVATLTAGAAFAIAQAVAFGLEPSQFLDVVTDNPVDSPYLQAKGRMIVENRTDDTQFALDGLRKDLALILEADLAAGVPTTLVDALLELFGSAADQGLGSADISAVGAAFRPVEKE